MQIIPFIGEPDETLLARLAESAPLIHVSCRVCAAPSCIDLRILPLDAAGAMHAAQLRSLLRCRQCGSGTVRLVQAMSMSQQSVTLPVQ